MAISITNIGTKSGGSVTSISLTTGISVPVGALIVVCAAESTNNGTIGTVADSVNSGNYSSVGVQPINNSTNGSCNVYYFSGSSILSSSATITYSGSQTPSSQVMSAFYATGVVASSALDTNVTQTSFGLTGFPETTYGPTTSGTPSESGELFVGALFVQKSTAYGSGFYVQDTGNNWSSPPTVIVVVGAQSVGGGTQVNSGSGAITFAPTSGIANLNYCAFVLGFLPTPPLPEWGHDSLCESPWQHRRIERFGALAHGDDGGINYPYQRWLLAGWEVQPWQPPHRGPERKPASLIGGDNGVQFPFNKPWRLAGWEVQPWQPPHRGPERKPAPLMVGEPGIQFLFNKPWRLAGWEVQPWQPPPLQRSIDKAAIFKGDAGVDFPFNQWWFNIGWEVQPPPPPALQQKTNRAAAIFRGDDSGLNFPHNRWWFNAGWEVQPWNTLIPNLRPNRAGAIQPKSDGIEAAYFFNTPSGIILPLTVFDGAVQVITSRPNNISLKTGSTGALMLFCVGDISTAGDITLLITRSDGSELSVEPTIGDFSLMTFVGFMPTDTYATYLFTQGDLTVIGTYTVTLMVNGVAASQAIPFSVTL